MIESIGIYPQLFDFCGFENLFTMKILIDRKDGSHNHILNNQYWHREETIDSIYPAVMMWANIFPTEIKLPHETIFIPQQNELVLIDNRQLLHRAPTIPDDKVNQRRFIMIRFLDTEPTRKQLHSLRMELRKVM